MEEEKLLASKHGKHVLLRRPKLQLLSENFLTDSEDKYKNALHSSFKSYGNSLKGNSVKLSSGSVDLDIANVDVQPIKNNKIEAFTTFIDNSFTLKLRPLGRPNVIAPQMTKHSLLSAEDERKGLISNAFSLQDFMAETTKIDSLPVGRVEKIINAQSGDRFQKVLENRCQSKCKKLHIKQFDLPDDLPNFTHRIPQRQLLIEMASVIKEHFLQSSGVKLKASIQASSRFRPCFQHDKNLGAEIIFYQNYVANLHKLHLQQLGNSEVPGKSTFLSTAASNYFQGTKRSSSPFDIAFSNSISPAEVSVLESVLNGGETLNLKAHFISNLPKVQPLMNTLVYLDLSFNNFEEIPSEVFNFTNLNKLKLRNNPLNELPYEITRLQTIKTLIISFCLFDDFPQHLFELKGLEDLNISYNTISCIPSDIACLQKLYSLNIEGNKLHSLPASMLKMFNLRNLQTDNNFMHPVFWNDTDSLYATDELCRESQIVTVNSGFAIQRQCDFCYGQINNSTGYRAVRPLKILGLRNLPFFFCCCSEKCFHSALKAEVIKP